LAVAPQEAIWRKKKKESGCQLEREAIPEKRKRGRGGRTESTGFVEKKVADVMRQKKKMSPYQRKGKKKNTELAAEKFKKRKREASTNRQKATPPHERKV